MSEYTFKRITVISGESLFKPSPKSSYSLAKAFQRNCPRLKLTKDEEDELVRLFKLCRDSAKAKGEENDV